MQLRTLVGAHLGREVRYQRDKSSLRAIPGKGILRTARDSFTSFRRHLHSLKLSEGSRFDIKFLGPRMGKLPKYPCQG